MGKHSVLANQLSHQGQLTRDRIVFSLSLCERLWHVLDTPLLQLFAVHHSKKIPICYVFSVHSHGEEKGLDIHGIIWAFMAFFLLP